MEIPGNKFLDLIDIVKSWIPRRSEPTDISKEFWMPDHSCRVCYDCDSQFTVFNRRHHCRMCGLVFCSRCTANSIPPLCENFRSTKEDWDRVRVCNYCFKQWEQDIAIGHTGTELSSPGLSPSVSLTSLASIKSSITTNSCGTFGSSVPCSTGSFQHVQHISNFSPGHSIPAEMGSKKRDMMMSGKKELPTAEICDPSLNELRFCLNSRSDDEDDDEYGVCSADSDIRHFQPSDECYNTLLLDDLDYGSASCSAQLGEENIDPISLNLTRDGPSYQISPANERLEEESGGADGGEECDAPSSVYGQENSESELVDFENNRLLWLPPEPEDGEEEREAFLLDNDDEDATGEWKQLRTCSSFGSGEYRSKDRTSEEHRKAMKNVVEEHFRALVAQLLQVENLPVGEEEGQETWLDIVTSLSWEAATLLKPDTSKSAGMDPGGYVKVKCISCGRRSESEVVKGVVCKKNVAHRRMASKIRKPRFLLLGGALEYQRVSNLLSSVDTLLQQEMDHLKMAVAKIASHHPNVLLVEKSVSRFAQEYLLAKEISLVLNIRRPVLERIARCTGAQIVPSIDHLSSQKLGFCEFFHVEKYLEDHGNAGQGGKKLVKTLMFFDGCPKPLGFTILLKGACGDELKKVKHVVQYGVFAAYHLALETSFLADEGASLPELPLKSPITVTLPDKPSSGDRSISMIPGFVSPASNGRPYESGAQRSSQSFQSELPVSDMDECVREHAPKHVTCLVPESTSDHGLTSLCNDTQDLCLDKDIMEPHFAQSLNRDWMTSVPHSGLHESCGFGVYDAGSNETVDVHTISLCKVTDTTERVTHTYSQHQPSASYLSQDTDLQEKRVPIVEEFPPSPSDHQSILVSLSTRCVWSGTVCERAHLFRIKYYGNFDKPLGRFLRDHLFDQSFKCRSCDMPTEAHVHCYTHRQGSLTISVKKLPELFLPGEQEGKVWMWHRCLRCPRVSGFPPATRRIVMSDAAWGLSFGKFLELSFSNHAAASRVASCGHSLHRDCLRFYGFGNMVACFRYASIDVHSVYLPPHKLDFNYEHQDWVQKEVDEVAKMAEVFFKDAQSSLLQIAEKTLRSSLNDSVDVFNAEHHIRGLESLLLKEKAEFEDCVRRALDNEPKKGHPFLDILEINGLRRQMIFKSYTWDRLLVSVADMQSSNHDELANSLTRTEKIDTIEKLAETNLATDSKPLPSCDDRLINIRSDESLPVIFSPSCPGEIYSLGDDIGKLANSQLECFEAGGQVRRALSEGQFPLLANLSDTLDAAWTGETNPANTVGRENNFAISEPFAPRSIAAVKSAASMPDSSGHFVLEDKNQVEVFPEGHMISAKDSNHGEDFTSWTNPSFMTLYSFFNKNSGSGGPVLDYLCDYSPVYVLPFWELDHQGGARLHLPVGVNDTVIPVYDDEPTSIISYALISPDYCSQMSDEKERTNSGDSLVPLSAHNSSCYLSQSTDEVARDLLKNSGSVEDGLLSMMGSRHSVVLDPLSYTKAMHVRVSFGDDGPHGKVKYTVTCYYAKRFEALRNICCPSELDFVRSLSRCRKWGAQGGKSNVFFAKTLDDRFIIKQVTKTELESFIKFAPEYFKYLSESIGSGSPTCLAKILGIYQVMIKNLKGGRESRMDVLVMENLLFHRNITRLYDLKGSSRSRYNPDSGGSNKVLLDQNLIESMPTSPIFVGNKAKRLLERAVWNDTSFLASIDVMDYSLLVGVDEERHELVLGIIDFVRQYTWDKHLETWVKASGILGGPKNTSPTVISPKQYKRRFRKAMSAYFLMVPDQWSPPSIIPSGSQSDFNNEESQQNSSME